MAFQSLIKLLRDGVDKVDAGTLNRILRALDGNVRYIKDLVDASVVGKNLIIRGAAVEADAVKGMAVYWNDTTGQYERALAQAETDDDDNLVLAKASKPWGIISSKSSSTVADIVLSGYLTLDISAAVTGDVEAGVYYLSSTTAGKLVTTPPAVTITMLQADGQGNVLVRPFFRDALDLFATVDTTVTSLVSLSDRLIIKCATDNTDAATGPLTIDLELAFNVDDSSLHGGCRVLKSLEDDTFYRGLVVEQIVAGTGVTISYTAGTGQGTVTVNADLDVDGKALVPSDLKLINVHQEFYKDIIGYEMAEDRTSSVRGAIDIPNAVADGTSMKFRFWLLARDDGDLPVLTLTYRKLTQPTGSTPETLVTSDTSLAIDTDINGLSEDEYVQVESDTITVNGGDRVYYTLARASTEAGPNIQIIYQAGILVS